MKLSSLGRRTDLIFARFNGEVFDRGNYLLIRTPSNQGFHFGNYLIFDTPPKPGDLKVWKEVFDKEFHDLKDVQHYTFCWDDGTEEKGSVQEFVSNGFEYQEGVVLSTKELVKPKHYNEDIIIKKIKTDDQWKEVIQLQILCADPKYMNDYFINFKKEQMANYRRMSEKGLGSWFGAYLEDKLVGDLGIFFENEIARYQNVGTHPDFRKRGICGTLVYEAGNIGLEEFKVDGLVMEADPDYHAARIYESVGFKRCETNHALSWWQM